MATKLKNLKIKKVDFVDEGANPRADIKLFKNKDGIGQTEESVIENPNFWKRFTSAVIKAFREEGDDVEPKSTEVAKSGAESFNDRFNEIKNRKICDEIWDICFALKSSLCSILNDKELDSASAGNAMTESLNEFTDMVSDTINQWCNGKLANIAKKDLQITASDLNMMELAKARLEEIIEKSGAVSNKGTEEDDITNLKGDKEEMKIDKSKLTEAEKAFLESIEKRYGTEDGAQVETPAQATEVAEPPVTKSVTPPAQAEQNQTSTELDGADIYKGLHPAVKAEMEALKKFKEDAEERELGEVAKKYEIIGKKKEDLVPIFKSLRAAGGTAYDDMIAVLDSAVTTVEKSGVFSEIGKSGHGAGTIGTAEAKIEGIAKKYQEQDATLSYEAAVAKAWENNPDLMDEYEEEAGF